MQCGTACHSRDLLVISRQRCCQRGRLRCNVVQLITAESLHRLMECPSYWGYSNSLTTAHTSHMVPLRLTAECVCL